MFLFNTASWMTVSNELAGYLPISAWLSKFAGKSKFLFISINYPSPNYREFIPALETSQKFAGSLSVGCFFLSPLWGSLMLTVSSTQRFPAHTRSTFPHSHIGLCVSEEHRAPASDSVSYYLQVLWKLQNATGNVFASLTCHFRVH